MNKLFVYGIFLSEDMRKDYGMTNPRYATVSGWATVGSHIVQAVKAPKEYCLTGLLVEVPDNYDWQPLDSLERGYERIKVKTVQGTVAYMYAERSENEQA